MQRCWSPPGKGLFFPGMRKTPVILFLTVLICASSAYTARRGFVDINRADAERLAELPGVSPELAEAIVETREKVNFFRRINDLMEVEGMTGEIFDGISPMLIMTPPGALRADEIIEELEIMEEEEEDYFLELDVDISRLEAYRSSPLDLNTAVYSQLLELPEIDHTLAEAILSLRRQMRGFDTVEDIVEVVGPGRFERIRPFVAVLDETELVRLHGDFRVSAEVIHPYDEYYFSLDRRYQYPLQVEARHRLRYGNRLELGLQIRRKASPHFPPRYDGARKIDYGNLSEYYLGTRYLLMRSMGPFDTVVLGSYRLDYFGPATRTRRLRGLRIDERTSVYGGFYGAAAETRPGDWEVTVFLSEKELPFRSVNEYDGSVPEHQGSLYDTANLPIYDPYYLKESIYGGILRRELPSGLKLSAGGYLKSYDRVLDHEGDFNRFRGDEIRILDLEAEYTYRNYRVIADWGMCRYHTFDAFYDSDGLRIWEEGREWRWDTGYALRLAFISHHDIANFWIHYWSVDHDYFDFPGEGRLATYNARNEVRYTLGGRVEPRRGMHTQADLMYQEKIKPVYRDTRLDRMSLRLRQSWDVTQEFLLRYSGTLSRGREWRTVDARYSPRIYDSHRLEIIHRPSARVRLRGVFRRARERFDETAELISYDTDSGNYGEIRYRPVDPLLMLARIYINDGGNGLGWRIRPVYTFSRHARLRMEFEKDPRAGDDSRSTFSVQYDMSF